MSVTYTSNVSQALSELKKAKARALEICGGTVERYAKEACPVGTPESTGIPGYIGGTLKNSISHEQRDENTEVIGTNVYYAPFVELGTVKMKARPYLRPALENHMDEYKKIVETELKGK